MKQNPLSPMNDDKPEAPTRYHWLPILSVESGMVIARPVTGLSGSRQTLFVAAGATLTPVTIEQLMAKGVECVAVFEKDATSTATSDHKASDFQSRLEDIFGHTPNEVCQPLFTALLAAREVLC